MPKHHGTIEWDDDHLTPGRKKEGGLHQNLFDKDGKLKGSARFIPDEDQPDDWDDEPEYELDPQYAAQLEMEERRRELQRQEYFEFALKALFVAAHWSITEGRPWWRETAQPALKAKWEKRPRRRKNKPQVPANEPLSIAEMRVEVSKEVAEAKAEYRQNMSSQEAQARIMLALFLRELSDEQLAMVANADIEFDEGADELERKLATLPQEQVTYMIETLLKDPSSIEAQLVDFAKLMGLEPNGDSLPIEER